LSLPGAQAKTTKMLLEKLLSNCSPERDIEPCGTGFHW